MNQTAILSILLIFIAPFHLIAQDQAGYQENTPAQEKVASGPKASWDKLIHDYGEIVFNAKEKAEFTLTNTGSQPLLIVYGQTTCGCAHLEYDEVPILPGKSSKITITYHGTEMGDFMKTISMVTNADTDRTVLQVKGSVVEK
jgi:hypothetical protein